MSEDLFSSNANQRALAPLAEQLRPQTPDEVIGQQHLLGPGKPLRLAFASGQPHSMILWGPPGVGKTTLARMMATQFQCEFIALSAVFSGIREVREAVNNSQAAHVLVTDELLRTSEEVQAIVQAAKSYQSEPHIISTSHEGGEKLRSMGGIGAVLRFKLSY